MPDPKPRISIGCPIFNSKETSLRRSLDSLEGQTFTSFEAIICDNSTDASIRDICMEYVDRDSRFRYHHNGANFGANYNFIRALHLAEAEYFKWVADDDKLEPTYLEKCVAVLDADPSVSLCYTHSAILTPEGDRKDDDGGRIVAMQESPVDRFKSVLTQRWKATGYYGVFRTDHVRRAHPMLDECMRLDDVLMLAEITLYGKIHQIPEELFTYTENPKPWDDREQLNARHYDACLPNNPLRGITFPNLKFAYELIQAVRYSPIDIADKEQLYACIPSIVKQILHPVWKQEIQRAIFLILNGRLLHNWGDDVQQPALSTQGTVPHVFAFHAGELLRRFDEVLHLWPDYPDPGFHTARAALFGMCGRLHEAQFAVQLDLARFPNYEVAQKFKAQLDAAMRG